MKGEVFIAWSGNNHIANQVKQLLEEKNFTAIVGGVGANDSADELFVGATVLAQIEKCPQAIFVVQKKDDGTISSNLMFELGYSLARLDAKRIHIFYVDISIKDDKIPSDLQGIWAHFIKTDDDTNIAEKIVSEFIAKQKSIVTTNKMDIISSYYSFKEKFSKYKNDHFCNEYELAQYVLFFGQASYMFDDEEEGLKTLKKLIGNIPNPTYELSLSIKFTRQYLEIFKHWQRKDKILYINYDFYNEIKYEIEDIYDQVIDLPENDFTNWFLLFIYDALNYINILCSFCPEISDNKRKTILDASYAHATKCLEIIEKLSTSDCNHPCLLLFKAYMYRNISTYLLNTDSTQEKIHSYLKCSFQTRDSLLRHYRDHNPNAHLLRIFEMEYYLAVSELLANIDNDEQIETHRERHTTKCLNYLKDIKTLHNEKRYYIEKIEQNMRSLNAIAE